MIPMGARTPQARDINAPAHVEVKDSLILPLLAANLIVYIR